MIKDTNEQYETNRKIQKSGDRTQERVRIKEKKLMTKLEEAKE